MGREGNVRREDREGDAVVKEEEGNVKKVKVELWRKEAGKKKETP